MIHEIDWMRLMEVIGVILFLWLIFTSEDACEIVKEIGRMENRKKRNVKIRHNHNKQKVIESKYSLPLTTENNPTFLYFRYPSYEWPQIPPKPQSASSPQHPTPSPPH